MTDHTPGPWVAGLDIPGVANNDPDARLVWHDSLLVADCRTIWISRDRAEANARLIAAAPDLLAACQALVKEQQYYAAHAYEGADYMPGNQFYSDKFMAVVRMARAALAKAIGNPETSGS